MTSLTRTHPPRVAQDRDRGHAELLADLAAITGGSDCCPPPIAVLTRPHLLRQLAAQVAVQVPPEVDRLVSAEINAALVVAVALHTGLPFCLVGTGPATVTMGVLHPAEVVAVVRYCLHHDPKLDPEAAELGACIGCSIAAWPLPEQAIATGYDIGQSDAATATAREGGPLR